MPFIAFSYVVNQHPLTSTTKSWNCTCPGDNEVSGVVTHGFSVVPAMVWIVPLLPVAFLKRWVVQSVTPAVINLAAISAVGGGLEGTPQIQVVAMLPFSFLGSH